MDRGGAQLVSPGAPLDGVVIELVSDAVGWVCVTVDAVSMSPPPVTPRSQKLARTNVVSRTTQNLYVKVKPGNSLRSPMHWSGRAPSLSKICDFELTF